MPAGPSGITLNPWIPALPVP
ncbi:MAG: hypothetical protein H6P99_2722, partial [Holophagaceae bacterium]|nr:hypothetical protein [Holophagaceae bacterium]